MDPLQSPRRTTPALVDFLNVLEASGAPVLVATGPETVVYRSRSWDRAVGDLELLNGLSADLVPDALAAQFESAPPRAPSSPPPYHAGVWAASVEFPTPDGPAHVVVLSIREPMLPTFEELTQAFGLTPQEYRVVRLLDRRLSTREVGEALGISPHTARHHISNAMAKLGLSDRRTLSSALTTWLREKAETDLNGSMKHFPEWTGQASPAPHEPTGGEALGSALDERGSDGLAKR